MKVVLDSNIYIAAYLSQNLASEILELGIKNDIEIYTSSEILNEVKTRLIGKLNLEEKYVEGFISRISESFKIIIPQKALNIITADPSDNKILECAIEAKANLIVTMDKHLLKLKSFQGIGIVHPKTLTWILPDFF